MFARNLESIRVPEGWLMQEGQRGPRAIRRRTALALGNTNVVAWRFSPGGVHLPPSGRQERVLLHIVRKGTLAVRWDDEPQGAAPVRSGQAFFTRGDRADEARASSPGEVVTLTVPDELFPGRAGFAADGPVLVRSDSALLAPIADFVLRAVDTEATDLTAIGHYYLERMLQEMAVALSLDVHRLREVPTTPDMFTRAITIISAQCADPDISSASVAADVRISVRQLERVFRERGTTIAGELRRARIEHAAALLRDRQYDALSIDQIARYSGFSNGSSLARAMRAEGWEPPARIRSRS
jgi:AraC-like DNA-binding protein